MSIIIPVKNAAAWIDDCMESIQAQTFTDWECILINDHSSDSTEQHISVHTFFDARFRLVHNNGNGLISAYQTGLELSKGTFITRMDADDLMPPDRLELMSDALKNVHDKTIITGKVSFFPENELGIGTRFYENWLNQRMDLNDHWQWIWRECVIPSPCWMTHKADLISAGGFEGLEYPEDHDLAFRLMEAGFKVLSLPQVLHHWRQHANRYSRTSDNYSAEKFMAMKWRWFEKLELRPDMELYVLGTGAKAKLLAGILLQKGQPFKWLSHEQNLAGNVFSGIKIQWLNDTEFPTHAAVISTLSTIDNFDGVYAEIPEHVKLYRFC